MRNNYVEQWKIGWDWSVRCRGDMNLLIKRTQYLQEIMCKRPRWFWEHGKCEHKRNNFPRICGKKWITHEMLIQHAWGPGFNS
jgi:hypothetical protein